jgi:hypothetical protein
MKLLSSTVITESHTLQCGFTTSAKYVAVGLCDFSVHVFDLNGLSLRSFLDQGCRVWGIAISGEIVLFGGPDGEIKAHDIGSG